MPSFSAELVARTALSPRVELLTFLAAEPFARAAGQYLLLTLDEGSSHAFSIAAPFDERAPSRFEIAVARGTTAGPVLELELGDSVLVTGPSGALVWKADAPALLVATGTGISPLRAIVLEQLARSGAVPLTLLFGCRDASEELWGAEFARLAAEQPRFRYLPTHSQPLTGHAGRIGRVQTFLPEQVLLLGSNLRAYLCGHTPMVNDCTTLLIEHGVPAEHIHGESY
jgi:CDP-4-dehydro-6-deoxyglucose reductase